MPEEIVVAQGRKFKLIEIKIDEQSTIRREVPLDTTEEDIPDGATLLSEAETEAILTRQGRVESFKQGYPVRLRTTKDNPEPNPQAGSVVALLKKGSVQVRWDDGTTTKHAPTELQRIY